MLEMRDERDGQCAGRRSFPKPPTRTVFSLLIKTVIVGNTFLAPSLSERMLMKPKLLDADLQGALEGETSSPPPKGAVVLPREHHTKSQLGVVVWIDGGELVTDYTADDVLVLTDPPRCGSCPSA